jgi:hypothetical protein
VPKCHYSPKTLKSADFWGRRRGRFAGIVKKLLPEKKGARGR